MISLNTNTMAASSASELTAHYGRLATSVKRLSTGLRINLASDDAAGLAIRELMRNDIAVYQQGMRNANDAISLLQVADAALGIIDEKLIRMKELAEQAATGTYSSTQRLMIHSEFQAMGSEIDRIAAATDFNGVKLLNGSLNGRHDGSGLEAKGELKIHFGTGNDSAEDYYYVNIGDCSTKGLGLRESEDTTTAVISRPGELAGELKYEYVIAYPPYSELNDQKAFTSTRHGTAPFDVTTLNQGQWYCGVDEKSGSGSQNTLLLIKAGTKNFVLNEIGSSYGTPADNDIQLFTLDGKHLAGRSPIPDYNSFDHADKSQPTNLATISERIGFDENQYDNSYLNKGVISQDDGYTMNFTSYNGMTIGYSGDGAEEYDNISRYEVLFIDEAKEDLVVWMPGVAGAVFKYYLGEAATGAPLPPSGDSMQVQTEPGAMLGIETQEKAQQALERIDDAVARKDTERAHLGALQNRFENTVANIAIQYQSIQSAESRISDADIAREMTEFVRGQVLAQSATAILAQANSSPNMLLALLQR